MALVDDILAWAAGLPAWQSDALRRLFRNGALSAQDQGEVLALLKEQHGGGLPRSRRFRCQRTTCRKPAARPRSA